MPYADPQKKREHGQRYRAANREKLAARHKEYLASRGEKERARKRQWQRTRRGMVDAPDEVRDGPCAICGRVARLVLDHNHETGAIRDWLCVRCNVQLAPLDNREWRAKAEAYLVAHQ